jgi:hypothetical protein
MREQQITTQPASTEWLMSQRAFAIGVADARADREYPPEYDEWGTDPQWNYERGRAWARLAPRSVPLMTGGRLNRQAVQIFRRHSRYIL